MTARLPVPHLDVDVWAGILNEFLQVAHNADGTLKGGPWVKTVNGSAPDGAGNVTVAGSSGGLVAGSTLSDLAAASTARTNLGLGTAATANTGAAAGNVPVLGTGGVLPIGRVATGTPTGGKFVRDDGTLAVPAAADTTAHVNEYHPLDLRRYGVTLNTIDATTADANTAKVAQAIADALATLTPGMKFQNSSGAYMAGAQANGGGGIYVPPGTLYVGNIVLEHRVELWSDTWGGHLLRKAGSSGDWITNRRDGTRHAGYCKLRGLTLDGNAANQTATGTAVKWQGDTTYTYNDTRDEDYDVHCETVGCQIINVKGDAIRCEGSGENKILSNFIRSVTGLGIYVFQDNWVMDNSVGHTGTYGYHIAGDDCRVNGNKAWYTGEGTASQGAGFYITSDSGAGAGNSAQDTAAQGVLFDGAYGWTWQAMIDSASKSSSGTYAGLDIYGSQYLGLDVIVRNRYRNDGTYGPCRDGINHAGGSTNNFGEVVVAQGVWGVQNLIKSGSSALASKIRVNGALMT